MKKQFRIVSLALACLLAVSLLSGCGFIKRLDGETEPEFEYAPAGGSVAFPEGFIPTGKKNTLETVMLDSTLCGNFTQVPASKTTGYFYPASDTLTVTANGTTDGKLEQFRLNLWKNTDMGAEWQQTVYFRTDGVTATATFTGLDTNARYRVSVAFDGATTSCSGSFNVGPLASAAPAAEPEA